jgi:SAM-dependent methyltransferase
MGAPGAEFDRLEGSYEQLVEHSIAFSGRSHDFFLEAKARRLLELARRLLGDPGEVRALDVGCGEGLFDSYLGELGGLEGVDVSPPMVEAARVRNPNRSYHVADGTRLPFEHDAFDLSFAVCVLHHVEPNEREPFVAELGRVTRPGGLVVVFEHNPWNPLTRLAVARCPFDEDAVLLARRETTRRLRAGGLRPIESSYILFVPWNGRVVSAAERVLAPVPLGAQYYVAAEVISPHAARTSR